MRQPRQVLLALLLLAFGQTATAEQITAYCEITNSFGTYTYTAVASALWGVGAWNPNCSTLPDHPCDYHYDYLTAQYDIENTQLGSIRDSFSGEIENPNNEGCLPMPCPPDTTPTELDYSYDFDLPLPTYAACAYGTLFVTGGNIYGADGEATATTQSFCWQKTLCHLGIGVVNGSLLPGASSGYYDCTQCANYFAVPVDPSYCFMGWSGDLSSSDPSISFCFDGSDISLTATFDVCPPCDPSIDPTCPCDPSTNPACACDPATDPTCGCDPVMDPTCCDPMSDPTCGCDPAVDPWCGGGDCDPVYDPDCCIELGTCEDNDDPIVINLNRGPWRLAGADNPVLFDMHATGRKVKIGWTAPGANLAFLALDRNGNGTIDDGSELFGNVTPLANGHVAPNGFEALAQYDSNHHGGTERNAPIWKSLLLWVDQNHDGISQPGELMPISKSQVTSILLSHRWTGRHDTSGNTFRYKGAVHFGRRAQSFFDIFFVTVH